MREEPHGEVTLDRCLACGGLWFDADELAAYLRGAPAGAAVPASGAPGAAEAPLRCPRCATQPLRGFRVRGVPVRSCPGCEGLFLGPDALETLLARQADAGYSAADVAVDVALYTAPDLPEAILHAVLDFLGDVFAST